MRRIVCLVCFGMLLAPPAHAQGARTPEQELIAVENDWNEAVIKRDVSALRQFYADEYVSTDSEGMVWNKAQDIAIDTAGASRLTSFKLEDLKVHVYGDVAVVTGRSATKGTTQGAAARGLTRFTDVFVKRDGRWQCVANQATASVFE